MVRSESFGLVTERRHYKPRPIYGSGFYVAQVLSFIIECCIARFLCAVRVFDVRPPSSPVCYHCAKFRFCRPHIAELARAEKSRTQSLTHPAYLIYRELKLSLRSSVFKYIDTERVRKQNNEIADKCDHKLTVFRSESFSSRRIK